MGKVFLNGNWIERDKALVSVFDRGFMFGDAVYEVLAVSKGKIRYLKEHLKRLENSLKAVEIDSGYTADEITGLLNDAIKKSKGKSGLLYLQITRGVQYPRDHTYSENLSPSFLITYSERKEKSWKEVKSLNVITKQDFRWGRGDLKVTSIIANVMLRNGAIKEGCDDVILIRRGLVTEAAAANVFIVKGQKISTPKKNRFFLHGITREIVLEISKNLGFDTVEREVKKQELFQADEVWLASTGREICPVKSIDGKSVGGGVEERNSVWKTFHEAYRKRVW
ncbi:MAG: aminotransferase class IV [Pseudomonadota bacterium]|nr:aminotransferase class IV [Pseudomonadota bacterium]